MKYNKDRFQSFFQNTLKPLPITILLFAKVRIYNKVFETRLDMGPEITLIRGLFGSVVILIHTAIFGTLVFISVFFIAVFLTLLLANLLNSKIPVSATFPTYLVCSFVIGSILGLCMQQTLGSVVWGQTVVQIPFWTTGLHAACSSYFLKREDERRAVTL
ncbi:MAG: hypothetical protein ACFBZ9_11200 [Sphingomonadales bacterium]